MTIRGGFLLSWLLCIGCAPRASLLVSALPAGQQQSVTITPGATLHSGDQFALILEVTRPLYVYAMRVVPGQQPERLFPAQGDHQARPGSPLHIPVDERRP